MIKERKVSCLQDWMKHAEHSGLPALPRICQRTASGLRGGLSSTLVPVEPGASRGTDYTAQAAQTPNVRESEVRFAAPPRAVCSVTEGFQQVQTTTLVSASIPLELTGRAWSDPRRDPEQITAMKGLHCSSYTHPSCSCTLGLLECFIDHTTEHLNHVSPHVLTIRPERDGLVSLR